MSKRRADVELNQDNWDDDIKVTEVGSFERADKCSLSNRKILSVRSNKPTKGGTSGLFKSFTGFDDYTKKTDCNFSFLTSTTPHQNGFTTTENATTTTVTDSGNYLVQLRSLNQCLLSWIEKHIKDDPYCILSPIFKDYDQHLEKLHLKFPSQSFLTANSETTCGFVPPAPTKSPLPPSSIKFPTPPTAPTPSLIAPIQSPTVSKPPFTLNATEKTDAVPLSFPAISSTTVDMPKPTFSFGQPPITSCKSAPMLFKFGNSLPSSSPFMSSLNPTISNPSKTSTEEDTEEYVPPKPVVKEIKEEGSVFSTRCKLFYKLETEWRERGVGNLFIKPTSDDKFQLLIRADTNLGNILLNVLITKDIPFKQQKNNLTFVCVPSPSLPAQPKPSTEETSKAFPMLIRVKSEGAATDLLEQIDRYRGVSPNQ